MSHDADPKIFEREWFDLAEQIVKRISEDGLIQELNRVFKTNGSLTLEQRSDFIAIANRIKYEVIHETYGEDGSSSFIQFRDRWRHWYNHKGVASTAQAGRKLTNAEHIVYSSTPDAEEFFKNVT